MTATHESFHAPEEHNIGSSSSSGTTSVPLCKAFSGLDGMFGVGGARFHLFLLPKVPFQVQLGVECEDFFRARGVE